MTKIKILVLAFISISLGNCKNENDKYPIDKRFWDTNDYANVIRELKYSYEPDEKLPTFNDPETQIIVKKLTDQENFKIVLDDNELGLKHRSEVATNFFNNWREMSTVYNQTDRKDNYIYNREMIEVYHFGLSLQLRYFKLGNDEILEGADDPNSLRITNTINGNINTLIKNFLNYLDEINNEKAFSEEGKELLSKGIDKYFTALIELYPNANYTGMSKKISLMEKKSDYEKIKKSLHKILELIESKKTKNL